MLIEPASNVSVPFTVVIRTRSKVAAKAIFPPEYMAKGVFEVTKRPEATQVFPVIFVITKVPLIIFDDESEAKAKPVVGFEAPLPT